VIMDPDIYTSITELAAVYETLNERLESDPCTTDAYQVYRQQTYRDACAALQAMPVEPIALRLIAEGISERVLTRLRNLIRENIHICETRKEFFRQVCFGDLCRLQEDYLFAGKRRLLLNDRKEIEEYPYPTEREREELLRENRAALNELDNERAAYRRENAGWIGRDYYTAIYEMSRFSASVLDSYFPVEKKTITAAPATMEAADQPTEFKSISPDGCSTSSTNWKSDWSSLAIWAKICTGRRNTRTTNRISNGWLRFWPDLSTTIISFRTAIRRSSVFSRSVTEFRSVRISNGAAANR